MLAASPYLDWLTREFRSAEVFVDSAFADADRHVMGYATGYPVDQIAPFVRSLRAHFDGMVTLVVDDDAALRRFLAGHDVRAVSDPGGSGWSPHIVVSRLSGYERLLRLARPDAAVLLTDVRDVIFQGDPLHPLPTGIEAFDEHDGDTFSAHGLNTKYATALASAGIVEMMSDQAALCVGTVVGPASDLIRLCRVMLMLCARPRSGMGGAFGADQAAFNLAVHLGLVDAEVRPNFSRVATLGVPDPDRLTIRDGQIVNPDGSVSPVVHQYDRHDHLMDMVDDRWGASNAMPPRRHAMSLSRNLRKHRDSVLKRIPELR